MSYVVAHQIAVLYRHTMLCEGTTDACQGPFMSLTLGRHCCHALSSVLTRAESIARVNVNERHEVLTRFIGIT